MNIKFLKIFLLVIVAVVLVLWFLVGLLIPCDKFVFLPNGEYQESSCVCIGKKVGYEADPNMLPGDYGTKCTGLGIFKNLKKASER